MKGLILREKHDSIEEYEGCAAVACCRGMFDDLFDGICEFDLMYKRFYMRLKIRRRGRSRWRILNYCPYCGTKLPNLNAQDSIYKKCLEQAVGKEFCDITEEEIPPEFKTDEWWRKRGL